jgi:hypothetical protein
MAEVIYILLVEIAQAMEKSETFRLKMRYLIFFTCCDEHIPVLNITYFSEFLLSTGTALVLSGAQSFSSPAR